MNSLPTLLHFAYAGLAPVDFIIQGALWNQFSTMLRDNCILQNNLLAMISIWSVLQGPCDQSLCPHSETIGRDSPERYGSKWKVLKL